MLLYSGTLHPSGPDSVAAIRFASPVVLHSLRIYPSSTSIFTHAPDILASTEPPEARLRIFFNSQLRHPKAKASNALAETSIAHTGGLRDYPIEWDSQYVTRLMIIQVQCTSLTISVYGEVPGDSTSSDVPANVGSAMAPLPPIQLHPSLHPACSLDPTRLACQLLSNSSRPVPLSLTIRLMFCIKPRKEDWDHPNFPLFLNLNDKPKSTADLVNMLSYPIDESCAREDLCQFANAASSLIEAHREQANTSEVAECLALLACHNPEFVSEVSRKIKLGDLSTDDADISANLCDAAAHPDLAQLIQDTVVRGGVGEKASTSKVYLPQRRAEGNLSFEEFLVNKDAVGDDCVCWLREVCMTERSLGIWLLSMIEHSTRVVSLGECAILDTDVRSFRSPWAASSCGRSNQSPVEFDDTIALIRGLIGVAAVFAVFAWSDSIDDHATTTRCLSIIRSWQHSDEYRELVESLLSLTQFMVRIERLLEAGVQHMSQAVVFAEQLLADLLKDPLCLMNADIAYTVRSMPHSLLSLPEHQRTTMMKLAMLAEGGIDAALSTLIDTQGSFREVPRLQELRLALAIAHKHAKDEDAQGVSGHDDPGMEVLFPKLGDLLMRISTEFQRTDMTDLGQETLAHGLWIFKSILSLIPSIPHPVLRDSVRLTEGICSLFVFLRSLALSYTLPHTHALALDLERSSIQVLALLGEGSSEVQARTLATLADADALDLHIGVDPVLIRLSCGTLLTEILKRWSSSANSSSGDFLTTIISIAPKLGSLWRTLPSQGRIELGRAFATLDKGRTGLVDWLLQAEGEHLVGCLQYWKELGEDDAIRHVVLSEADESLGTVKALLRNDVVSTIGAELRRILFEALSILSQEQICSQAAGDLVENLSKRGSWTGSEHALISSVLLLAAIPNPQAFLKLAVHSLSRLKRLTSHVDRSLRLFYRRIATTSEVEIGDHLKALVSEALRWTSSVTKSLAGFNAAQIERLFARSSGLTGNEYKTILALADAEAEATDREVHIPQHSTLTLHQMDECLRHRTRGPSTPPSTSFGHYPETVMLATVSPNASMLRSPLTTLAKTYTGDSFRQLRGDHSRQNMSRLPSLHVDAFQMDQVSSPLRSGHQRSISNSSATSVISIAMLPGPHLVLAEDQLYPQFPHPS